MERNFETVMIEQCAPVLAGLKAAGLFRQESRDRAAFYAAVAGWDARLAPKGVRVTVLKECPHSPWYLVYLYRPAGLYRERGPQLHLLRLLEELRRPRRRPPALCPAEQVHRHLPAPVPQRDAGAQADGGGVSRAKFAKSITTFVLAVC